MNTALRVIAALLLVGVLVGIGFGVYNAGVSQGLAQNVTAVASGAPAAAYGYYGGFVGPHWGWGWGFGVFGIFFWILGIFLIFALLRAALGWGRGGRYGRWAGPDGGGPGGWNHPGHGDPRRERLEEWHREAHGGTGTGSGTPPSAG